MEIKEIKQLEDKEGRVYVLVFPSNASESELDQVQELVHDTFRKAEVLCVPDHYVGFKEIEMDKKLLTRLRDNINKLLEV